MRSRHLGEETNLAGLVLRHRHERGEKEALIFADGQVLTYGELGREVGRVREGLKEAGFRRGDRMAVMIGVGPELYVLVLALLASGMTAVLIDGGMGKEGVISALKLSRARGMVSTKDVLAYRFLVPAMWSRKRYSIDGGGFGLKSFESLRGEEESEEPAVECERGAPGTTALITFTSGTTGRPKGANRTHDLLIAQHRTLREEFPEREDEIDMPCFPVVVLHNLCCGITTVIPDVDFRAPGKVEAKKVVEQIRRYGVTRMSMAPAYLRALASELERSGEKLTSLRRLICGGAPTPRRLAERLEKSLPEVEKWIIYGSTEAEPVAKVEMKEVLSSKGRGYLVGRPVDSAKVAVVDLPEGYVILDAEEMKPYLVEEGEVGEVAVRGEHVLRGYVGDRGAEEETKIRSLDGGGWHRMGDLARRDQEGRLWLVGRRGDGPVGDWRELYPYEGESELEELEGVFRAVLIVHEGAPGGEAVVVLDGEKEEARERVRDWLDREGMENILLRVLKEIPMDRRDDSKVDRAALRAILEAGGG